MASRSQVILRMRDPMDQWLESHGYYRKLIAKDGSCLFRAVSEQVFHTQVLHAKVRMACVNFMQGHKDLFDECIDGSLDEHIASMHNPWEWGGELEMRAMSCMYRRDFLIFRELGMPPTEGTCYGFKDKILLCHLGNTQYDSVYEKEYVKGAAFCQSIIYHLLYDRVFQMEDTNYAVDKMLHDKTVRLRRDSYMTACSTCSTVRKQNMNNMNENMEKYDDDKNEDDSAENKVTKQWYNNAKEIMIRGIIPFPYKVAKALDSEIYRNIEFDVWNEQRKELRWGMSHLLNGGGETSELRVGSKCLVRLDSSPGKELHAHIQEMALEKGPVLVYIEELAKKCIVQFETLEPIRNPSLPLPLMRCDRGKQFWVNEKKHLSSNSCLQNAVNIVNPPRHFGIQTWRQSPSAKHKVNYGRYENKGNSIMNKEGGKQKSLGNRNRGCGVANQNLAVAAVTSAMSRASCQPVLPNQDERYPPVLFTNPQLQLSLQPQPSENPVSNTKQVTPVSCSNTGCVTTAVKQSPPASNCGTPASTSENINIISTSTTPSCDCLLYGDKSDGQHCPIMQPIESDRQPWNSQPLCYCCSLPFFDWRSGSNGGSHIPSYISPCSGSPLPLIQPSQVFPCPSVPSGVCLTPESVGPEGRNLPCSDVPGYRFLNVGHDYFHPGYIAWPGANTCTVQQQDVEGVSCSEEEDKQLQQVPCTTIEVANSHSECPPRIPALYTSAPQGSTFTRQMGQSEQELTSHSDEEKRNCDQNTTLLRYTPCCVPPPVAVREPTVVAMERGREEVSLPSTTQADFSPSTEQEVESQNIGRWADTIRHIPPPVMSPYIPIQPQGMPPTVLSYSPPHGSMEPPQFYMCTTTGAHSPGHHMMFGPFPPHHSLPHPQPHLLPAAVHPRFVYSSTNGVMPPSSVPHQ